MTADRACCALFVLLVASLFFPVVTVSGGQVSSQPINVDGDYSLSPDKNCYYANPNIVNLAAPDRYGWSCASFGRVWFNETRGTLGHVAIGTWWYGGFGAYTNGNRIPLHGLSLTVAASVRLVATDVALTGVARAAIASAVLYGGKVYYTELDLWDSPSALTDSSGNVTKGGDVVYYRIGSAAGDQNVGGTAEFKVDQLGTGYWRSYALDFTRYIQRAWGSRYANASLESIYLVAEGKSAAVTADVDNLWLYLTQIAQAPPSASGAATVPEFGAESPPANRGSLLLRAIVMFIHGVVTW